MATKPTEKIKYTKGKKPKKIKTFVLTVSKNFLKKHPREGQPTNFKEKILTGQKKHTVRGNNPYWKRIVKLVNKGEAILSVRQWTGKPYQSKQIEIAKFTELDFQNITLTKNAADINIDYRFLDDKEIKKLANNDGLTLKDFQDWFPTSLINGIIIFFKSERIKPKKY